MLASQCDTLFWLKSEHGVSEKEISEIRYNSNFLQLQHCVFETASYGSVLTASTQTSVGNVIGMILVSDDTSSCHICFCRASRKCFTRVCKLSTVFLLFVFSSCLILMLYVVCFYFVKTFMSGFGSEVSQDVQCVSSLNDVVVSSFVLICLVP